LIRILFVLTVLIWLGVLLVQSEPIQESITGSMSNSLSKPVLKPLPILASEGCTIGVACGSVTADGRPLLWKSRDSGFRNNEVFYNTESIYNFISICNASLEQDLRAWMGVNECGFAVLNANIHRSVTPTKSDTVSSNGELMRRALGVCRSVSDFNTFLDTTAVDRFIQGSFGVIDSTGAAFVFEVVDSLYWAFDASETAEGYLIRTNFACNDSAEVAIGDTDGHERFLRSHELIDQYIAESSLDSRTLMQKHMRDFSDSSSFAVPVPFPGYWAAGRPWGFINTQWSICRQITVSSVVIQGVDPDMVPVEPAFLTTMWTQLGNPASAITVPYWPVGEPPAAASGTYHSPLCDISLDLKAYLFWYKGDADYIDSYRLNDGDDNGLWPEIVATEDSIFTYAEDLLSRWRIQPPTWGPLLATEDSLAERALASLQRYYETSVSDQSELPPHNYLQSVCPSPFNARTTISYHLPYSAQTVLEVYNIAGQQVAQLLDKTLAAGRYQTNWNASTLPSGSYFVRLRVGDEVFSQRCLLVK